jgi:prevent-host-death family protein
MKFANIRELKNKTSEILREAQKGDVIITSRGRPTAVITAITEEDFEDYLLEKSPKFQKALEDARLEQLEKGGISIKKYRKKRAEKAGAEVTKHKSRRG